MNAKTKVALAALTVLLVLGCERIEKTKTEPVTHTENSATVSLPEDDVTAATLARITSVGAALTNCLYRESDNAMAFYRQIGSEIKTLPPRKGEQSAKAVIRSVLDVPYEQLEINKRLLALDRMWDMMWGIDWPGMSVVDLWEARVLWLSRIRDVISRAQSETDSQARRYFIAHHSSRLDNRAEHFERTLAFWNTLPSSSSIRFYRYGEVTDAEYDIIKAKFEKFLGRPIRTYEEFVHAQRERDRQIDLEEERRRGGPDVKVDVGDL